MTTPAKPFTSDEMANNRERGFGFDKVQALINACDRILVQVGVSSAEASAFAASVFMTVHMKLIKHGAPAEQRETINALERFRAEMDLVLAAGTPEEAYRVASARSAAVVFAHSPADKVG